MIDIREARVADASAMAEVHVAAWHESYVGLLPEAEQAARGVEMRRQMWRRILETPGPYVVLVAEAEGGIVGFGSACDQRDRDLAGMGFSGEISALYLLDAVKRQGVGQRLVARLVHWLRAQGHDAMALWVLSGNGPARAFYERMGGAFVFEREDPCGDAVILDAAYGWPALGAISLDPASG